ncbi:MAG: hypothetical protein JXO72_02775 [Vicinamibacteria bacterium]|nr:hypothetical protein [Vicinamibacteria bacterium]
MSVRLSSAENVQDPVFSILIHLIESNRFGCLSGSQLMSAIESHRLRSRLPYRRLRELHRLPETDGARIIARFNGSLDLRMPYRILWYRPARLRADPLLCLREWSYPHLRMTFKKGSKATMEKINIQDVHVFGLSHGSVEADIDAWLDRLLGAALDDMTVVGFAVFRHHNVWTGLAVGYNQAGAGRSGLFDFARDAVVYPMPDRMRAAARQMRLQIETLMGVDHVFGR